MNISLTDMLDRIDKLQRENEELKKENVRLSEELHFAKIGFEIVAPKDMNYHLDNEA